MAINKKRGAEMEALIREAAAELKRLNPHWDQPTQPLTEAEMRELEEMDAELERLWDSPEGQRARALGYSVSDAISEDRGE